MKGYVVNVVDSSQRPGALTGLPAPYDVGNAFKDNIAGTALEMDTMDLQHSLQGMRRARMSTAYSMQVAVVPTCCMHLGHRGAG